MSDPLKRATEALRQHSDAPNLRSGLTRARVLDAAAKRYGARRRFALRWLVPIASVFVVGTALARVAESWPALREVMTFAPAAPASTPPRAAKRTRPAVLPARSDAVPVSPVRDAGEMPAPAVSVPDRVDEPTAREPVSSPHPPVRKRPAHTAPAKPDRTDAAAPDESAAAPPTQRAPSAELALFRRAQALHLAHADLAALAAWDAYLRLAVHGLLLPEAQYNRALCLIRLGRNVEARAALEPFARGAAAGYRRVEARALLDALPR